MPRNRSKRIPTISLFTGSGGMDLGFAAEGFDIRAAVEVDEAACATLRRNWPRHRARVIQRQLENVSTEELLRVAGVRVGEVGMVIGGPPCQSWCVAGNRRGFDDPRGQALLEFCRVVREARPRAFCIENVPGLLIHAKQDIVALISHEVSRDGGERYQLAHDVLDAAEFGVAQRRRRVFIVGWRMSGEFYFPAATHQIEGAPTRKWKRPATTVGVALRGLPKPEAPSEQAHRVAATILKRNEQWYGKR